MNYKKDTIKILMNKKFIILFKIDPYIWIERIVEQSKLFMNFIRKVYTETQYHGIL